MRVFNLTSCCQYGSMSPMHRTIRCRTENTAPSGLDNWVWSISRDGAKKNIDEQQKESKTWP